MVCSCVCMYMKTKPNKEVKHDHTKWFVWRIKHIFPKSDTNSQNKPNHKFESQTYYNIHVVCVLRHWNSYKSFVRHRLCLRLRAYFSKKFNSIIFFDEIHSYVKTSCDLINKFNWKTPREWVKKKHKKNNNDNNDYCTLVLSLSHNKLNKTTGCFCPCTILEMISWNKSNWQLKRKTKTKTHKAELLLRNEKAVDGHKNYVKKTIIKLILVHCIR